MCVSCRSISRSRDQNERLTGWFLELFKGMPQLTTAFSLLLGLGARILYNKLFSFRVRGIEDHVLSGLWQGVALYYVLMEFPFLTLPVGFGIGARLLVNFVITYDGVGCACTLLGVAVGVLFTDILSQLLEDGDPEDAYYEGSVVSDYPRRRRLLQFRGSSYDDERVRDHNRRRRAFFDADRSVTTAVTNTTNTWDSLSDWVDPNHSMTPLEREVAALRKKASMADSERRRFKEEKQWAQVQGNKARAAQMGWQVKRYSALMQSFHREADLRLLEGSSHFCSSLFPTRTTHILFFLVAFLLLQRTTSDIARRSHRCRHRLHRWQALPRRPCRCSRPRSPSRSQSAANQVVINRRHPHRARHPASFPLPTTRSEIDRCGLLLQRESSLSDATDGYRRRLTRTEMR